MERERERDGERDERERGERGGGREREKDGERERGGSSIGATKAVPSYQSNAIWTPEQASQLLDTSSSDTVRNLGVASPRR